MSEVAAQRPDLPHDTAHPLFPLGFGLALALLNDGSGRTRPSRKSGRARADSDGQFNIHGVPAMLHAMLLPERLRRCAYASPKELDEVRRLAEAEKLADRDRLRRAVHEQTLSFQGHAPIYFLLGRMPQQFVAGACQGTRRDTQPAGEQCHGWTGVGRIHPARAADPEPTWRARPEPSRVPSPIG